MIERSSVGYKGFVPRISYSRYFTVDNDTSNENILEEKISKDTTRAGDGRQKITHCDKIKSSGTIKLEKNEGSATENKIDSAGKKYLLPPPPKFKASTVKVKTSPREEINTNNRKADMKLQGQLPQWCPEFSLESCRCAPRKSVNLRPSSANSSATFTDEEMQRLKIINSWMQFFG